MQTRRQVVRRSRKTSCHSRAAFPSSCADCALCERRIGVHARAVPNGRKRSRVRFDAFDARTEREDLRCQLHSVASMASLPDVQPDRALRASLGAVGRCACDAIAALDDRIPAGKKDFDSIVRGRQEPATPAQNHGRTRRRGCVSFRPSRNIAAAGAGPCQRGTTSMRSVQTVRITSLHRISCLRAQGPGRSCRHGLCRQAARSATQQENLLSLTGCFPQFVR
jgi:hypothetical protein